MRPRSPNGLPFNVMHVSISLVMSAAERAADPSTPMQLLSRWRDVSVMFLESSSPMWVQDASPRPQEERLRDVTVVLPSNAVSSGISESLLSTLLEKSTFDKEGSALVAIVRSKEGGMILKDGGPEERRGRGGAGTP